MLILEVLQAMDQPHDRIEWALPNKAVELTPDGTPHFDTLGGK